MIMGRALVHAIIKMVLEVLDQSQANENQSEGQQDHQQTTENHREFSGHEWSATILTLGVTGV